MIQFLDWLLTSWASHEIKRDAQSAPSVLQEVFDTCSVENMPAAQSYNRISAELASVTNVTEVIFGG